jgi:DNA-directed RNA polymerase subunit N
MDELGIKRYCCRRMLLSHIDVIDEVAPFRK